MKLSVVITAFNEEEKVEECLKSVKNLADEIVFIDNDSSDKTREIAKKYTDKVYSQKNNPQKIDLQKNFGISKATGDWILILDADERVTEELVEEIKKIFNIGFSMDDKEYDGKHPRSNIQDPNPEIIGYWIPRKNIVFGKWIEHTGWYPDYQLRLIKKGKGKYTQESVHQHITVTGETGKLESAILHLNYDNVSQFLIRMISNYTVSESDALLRKGYKYSSFDFFKMPVSEFMKRYFAEEGYKDGMHGLVLSTLMSFYHFVVFVRLWEANNYPDERESEKLLKKGSDFIKKEFKYWIFQTKISDSKNIVKSSYLKIKRKIS